MAAPVAEERRAEIETWRKRTGAGWRAAAKAFPDVPANTIKSWFTRNARREERGAPHGGRGAPHVGKGSAKRSGKEAGKAEAEERKQEAAGRARNGANADLPAAPQLIRAGRIAVAQRMLWLAGKDSLNSKDQLRVASTMQVIIEAMPSVVSQATQDEVADDATLEDDLAAALGVDPEALRHTPLRAVNGGKA